jgi:glutathione S-transferase
LVALSLTEETMSELILHQYAISPFAEKVRLILGFKRLAWRSVLIPPVMPKPDVIALTGGYRKTPVLQIGADIYCDTALIARVLEMRQPTPTLYPVDVPLRSSRASAPHLQPRRLPSNGRFCLRFSTRSCALNLKYS